MNSVVILASLLAVMIFLVAVTMLWAAPNTSPTINATNTTNTTNTPHPINITNTSSTTPHSIDNTDTPTTIDITEATNTTYITEYGIILKFEGDKLVIDGKEICEDIVGDVIIKFGIEFQTIDVCELIEEGVIHIYFSEGVRYWRETLEELGIKPGMSAEEILATLREKYASVAVPTVSITFWLSSEGVDYIANYAFTSLDYFLSRGYDYDTAVKMMFENPLAIVEEHATIIIRSEDLVERLVPIKFRI